MQGRRNLISDIESEEMLIIDRSKVQRYYEEQKRFRDNKDDAIWKDYEVREVLMTLLRELFGDKCLPGDTNSQNIENCDKTASITLSDEALDDIITRLIIVRDNSRHSERELTEILAKLHKSTV